MTDPRELVRWNHDARARFAEYFENVPWDEIATAKRGATSPLQLFVDGFNVEDFWLHHVFPGNKWQPPSLKSFEDAALLREHVDDLNARSQKLLLKLSDDDLAKRYDYSNAGKGPYMNVSVLELLVEIVLQEAHARGELLAVLRAKKLEPPRAFYLDWAAVRAPKSGTTTMKL